MNRIASRLKRLEQAGAQQTDTGNKMLVELLGRQDALVYPRRVYASNHGRILGEMQPEFFAGRRGFSAKASGVVDWQAASEQRSLLIDRGLATALRTAGGEIGGLRLTRLGDVTARALVGLTQLHDLASRTVYCYLLAQADVTHVWLGGRWMAESLLWQRQLAGNPDSWGSLTEAVLPLLAAGYVRANYDGPGRVYYTNNHWDANGDPQIKPIERVDVDVVEDPAMSNAYFTAFHSEVLSLEKLDPSHELHIPVPASCFHEFMGRDSMPMRERETEQYRASRERFHAMLENRSCDTELARAIDQLETFLSAQSEKLELEL